MDMIIIDELTDMPRECWGNFMMDHKWDKELGEKLDGLISAAKTYARTQYHIPLAERKAAQDDADLQLKILKEGILDRYSIAFTIARHVRMLRDELKTGVKKSIIGNIVNEMLKILCPDE